MKKNKNKTITVSGVTFNADQIKTVTVKIDGREISITEKDKNKSIEFKNGQ